jgi:leucine dehydrogenase
MGGGKCVIIADRANRDIMLKAGEAVNHFGGDYIIAEDVGTSLDDIEMLSEVTPHTVHLDGSANTARGVLAAIRAAGTYLGEWDTFDGVPIWIQGLGKVGMDLATRLRDHTNLYVSDLRSELVGQAKAMGGHEISETDRKFIAVYAPCAMGQVVNAGNLHGLTYSVICGSANNQLADDSYAEVLQKNNVLYCPDWLVNSGGAITAAGEIEQWSVEEVEQRCDAIGEVLTNVFEMAKMAGTTPLATAITLAEARL